MLCIYALFVTVKLPNGTVVAKLDNPAVPQHILNEIHSWKEQGACMQDIVYLMVLSEHIITVGHRPFSDQNT